MTKANALDAIFDLARDLRDDRALWESEHSSDREHGKKSWWEEVRAPVVGGEVGRLSAFRVPLRSKPGRHIVIELKLEVGRLKLKFAPVEVIRPREYSDLVLPDRASLIPTTLPHPARMKVFQAELDRLNEARRRRVSAAAEAETRRRTAKTPRSMRARDRRLRAGSRRVHQFFAEPYTAVPLVPDDAELRALVALRCVRQRCYPTVAEAELRGFIRRTGVYVPKDVTAKSVIDDLLTALVESFVSGPPGALRRYIKVANKYVLGELAEATERSKSSDKTPEKAEEEHASLDLHGRARSGRREICLLTVRQFADRVQGRSDRDGNARSISCRTVYRWVERGKVKPAKATAGSYRFTEEEAERVRQDYLYKAIYFAVMKRRGCSYDAARMWVRRRRRKKLDTQAILKELSAPAGCPTAPQSEDSDEDSLE